MSVTTTRGTKRPAYQEIEDDLRQRIQSGGWPVGTLLPSRRVLAERYGVNLGTLQSAISALLADGTLRANPRQGTVVARGASGHDGVRRDAPAGVASAGVVPSPSAHATLGIIAGLWSPSWDPATLTRYDRWGGATLDGLEHGMAEVSGATRFFNRMRPNRSPLSDVDCLQALIAEGVDAVVIVFPRSEDTALHDLLTQTPPPRVPLVFIASSRFEYPFPYVCNDQRAGGYQAAMHLIQAGYRRLVFLSPFHQDWVEDRVTGARQAASHSAALGVTLTVHATAPDGEVDLHLSGYQEEAGYVCAEGALRAGMLDGAGMIAANDYTAIGLLQAAGERGLTPGRDFGLVSFDNSFDARSHGLTSLRPPLEAMGREAARLALCALRGEDLPQQVMLRSDLIPRTSTQFAPDSRRLPRTAVDERRSLQPILP